VTTRTSRAYTSTRRAQQAARTRAEIVAAATELFERDGWRGTTIAAVAARAGVVIDTIYAGFGSKAGLLAAAKDAARDADESGLPFVERPTFRGLAARPADERVAQVAAVLAAANERTWRLDTVWRDAAAFEPSVRQQVTQRELGRRAQFGHALELLLESAPEQSTVDAVWVLSGSDVYAKLVDQAGLTREEYTQWLVGTLRRLLDRAPAGPARPGGTPVPATG
jgi:AcrR family transcriptional regulator